MNANAAPRIKMQTNTQPKRIVRGILFGFIQGIITHIILLFVCGLIAMQSSDPVTITPYLGMIITPISALSGAFRCASVIGERGVLCGLGIGILYPFGLWMLSLSFTPAVSDGGKKQWFVVAIAFCFAVLGGYFGTHRKQKHKKHTQSKLPQRPQKK